MYSDDEEHQVSFTTQVKTNDENGTLKTHYFSETLQTEKDVFDKENVNNSVCTTTSGKYFPVQTEQTRLIRNLLYGYWL